MVEFRIDIYTEEYLTNIGLNQRQIKAVLFVKDKRKITNNEYQKINNTSDRTALRDLEKLLELDIIQKVGEKKGTYYKIKF